MSTDDGIALGEETRWVISGITDFETFFRNVSTLLPEKDSILYLEGTATAPDVQSFLNKHAGAPLAKIRDGTIWPRPHKWHIRISRDFLNQLEMIASRHTTPEIADHCHIYTTDGMILQWFDACDSDCPIGLARTVNEVQARAFAKTTNAKMSVVKSANQRQH